MSSVFDFAMVSIRSISLPLRLAPQVRASNEKLHQSIDCFVLRLAKSEARTFLALGFLARRNPWQIVKRWRVGILKLPFFRVSRRCFWEEMPKHVGHLQVAVHLLRSNPWVKATRFEKSCNAAKADFRCFYRGRSPKPQTLSPLVLPSSCERFWSAPKRLLFGIR